MVGNKADAVRIQTSFLNAAEKKILVWLAVRQPKWMTSDILTLIGTAGSLIAAAGYVLSARNISFLWLSSLGFVINWYGDSLDGTLARVRNRQRPVYGYYIDHTVDCISEILIFTGIGLSGLMHFGLAMLILALYLMLTINVSINAHLKKEFKLTYAKMGPTEFRLIAILVNTLFATVKPLSEFSRTYELCGRDIVFKTFDYAGVAVLVILSVIYLVTIFKDAAEYARRDPMPQ
jgi:phosphatidylglycerophosphate synthase